MTGTSFDEHLREELKDRDFAYEFFKETLSYDDATSRVCFNDALARIELNYGASSQKEIQRLKNALEKIGSLAKMSTNNKEQYEGDAYGQIVKIVTKALEGK